MVETDEEQLEVLKNWWDENGTTLVTTLVLGLAAIFGYRAWEDNVRETGEAASSTYQNLVQATSNLDDENLRLTALNLGEELKNDYEGSAYASFAALHLAKIAVEQGDLAAAQAELQWTIDQNPEAHLETIARMRLARVLVDMEDAPAALASLSEHEPAAGQQATWAEIRGDVYLALGDNGNARQAYQEALELLGDDRTRPLLELKLADIPLATEVTPTEEGA